MAASCLRRPAVPADEEQPAALSRRTAQRLREAEVALRRLAEVALRRLAEVVLQLRALVRASRVQALAPRSLSAAVQRRRAPPCTMAILWRHCA
jgi:hypothetical protein